MIDALKMRNAADRCDAFETEEAAFQVVVRHIAQIPSARLLLFARVPM